jgi:hypothetical protein
MISNIEPARSGTGESVRYGYEIGKYQEGGDCNNDR